MSFLRLVFLDAQLMYKCETQLYDCKYFFLGFFKSRKNFLQYVS